MLRLTFIMVIAGAFGASAFAQSFGGGVLVEDPQTPGVAIPDAGYIGTEDGNNGTGTDAGMACVDSDFSVINPAVEITDAEILVGITHTWVGDVVVKIEAPDGRVLTVFNRPGVDNSACDDTSCAGFGDSSNMDGTSLEFWDNGGAGNDPELMGSTIDGDMNICTDDAECQFSTNPDNTGDVVDFNAFLGTRTDDGDGIWHICVGDAAAGDPGTWDTVNLRFIGVDVTASEPGPDQMPNGYLLESAYPNPFNPSATIGFAVADAQDVDLGLYDALGRRVRDLYAGTVGANARTEVTINADGLPSGLYLVRLNGESFSTTRQVTLLK